MGSGESRVLSGARGVGGGVSASVCLSQSFLCGVRVLSILYCVVGQVRKKHCTVGDDAGK